MRARALLMLLVALFGLAPTALPRAQDGGCGVESSCCCAAPAGPSVDDGRPCACGEPVAPVPQAPERTAGSLELLPSLAPVATTPLFGARSGDTPRRWSLHVSGQPPVPVRTRLGVWLL